MVLYDAMIVVSAKVPKTACADVLRRLGASVMDAGGVVTNVASYGARTLAYEFRRPGEKHFEVRRRRSERSRGFARGTRETDARRETRARTSVDARGMRASMTARRGDDECDEGSRLTAKARAAIGRAGTVCEDVV